MYKVDPILLERFKNHIQTSANNNDPRLLAYIARNKTAISSQRFWEKQLITSTVGTRSSIALRRPKGHFSADMIFAAQVENGTAIIRYAEPWSNIDDMEWNILTTIPNVSELSIMFDGFMVLEDGVVESYTVGDYPVVVFVNTSGSLKLRNLNDTNFMDFTISDNAVNVASVRGLYSEAASINDGILVFYTNSSGELWEAHVVNYTVTELIKISIFPSGVTSWLDCWASMTFDYRIQLQLKGDDGKVYTLLSTSRPSGFAINEYITITNVKATGQIGKEPPKLLEIQALSGEIVRMKYDDRVEHVSSIERTRYQIIDHYNTSYVPVDVTYGENDSEVYLHFNNINNIVFPAYIECFETLAMGSDYVHFSAFNCEVFLDNLKPVPSGSEYLEITSVVATGEYKEAFNGKMYFSEYIGITNVAAVGTTIELRFDKRYFLSDHLTITGVSATGVYCDVNGNPL